MKREIVCESCYKDLKKMFPLENPYPGEHVKFVEGNALHSMVCDNCGTPIQADDNCFAFTIWADHGRRPYFPWESEYIKIKEEQSC